MKINKFISRLLLVFCAFLLALYAGFRTIGIDRENYIKMYNSVIDAESFTSKLFYSKDLLYLLSSECNNLFFNDPRLVFFCYIFVSFLVKLYFIEKIKVRSLYLFFFLYVLLLSTVLEFIAFRSALSLSFLLGALSSRDAFWIYFFLFLSILAHTSAILPAVCALPYFSRSVSRRLYLYAAIFLIPVFLNTLLLNIYPQGNNYIENQNGTFNALILPLSVLLSALLIFYKFERAYLKNPGDSALRFVYDSKVVIYALIFFSIGITPFVVIAATRYLEVVYLFLLIAGITMGRKSVVNLLGFLLLVSILIYLNVLKDLWINMFAPFSL